MEPAANQPNDFQNDIKHSESAESLENELHQESISIIHSSEPSLTQTNEPTKVHVNFKCEVCGKHYFRSDIVLVTGCSHSFCSCCWGAFGCAVCSGELSLDELRCCVVESVWRQLIRDACPDSDTRTTWECMAEELLASNDFVDINARIRDRAGDDGALWIICRMLARSFGIHDEISEIVPFRPRSIPSTTPFIAHSIQELPDISSSEELDEDEVSARAEDLKWFQDAAKSTSVTAEVEEYYFQVEFVLDYFLLSPRKFDPSYFQIDSEHMNKLLKFAGLSLVGDVWRCHPEDPIFLECFEDITAEDSMHEAKSEKVTHDHRIRTLLGAVRSELSRSLALSKSNELVCLHFTGLNQVLAEIIVGSSIMESSPVFLEAVGLCGDIGREPQRLSLLRPDGSRMKPELGNHVSIYSDLKRLQQQAISMNDTKGSQTATDATRSGSLLPIMVAVAVIDICITDMYTNSPKTMSESGNRLFEVSDEKSSDTPRLVLNSFNDYLRDNAFAMVSLSHCGYTLNSDLVATHDKGRLIRIRKEMLALSTSLPSGVFVRVDEDRYDKIRFCIVGPRDTPYSHGFFLFDMSLPPDYPNSPPHVNFLTTGGSTFRFNANLYVNGKVCLSLLGTWEGPGWDPDHSTLLQVLVSIQAFIFCERPYVSILYDYKASNVE